MTATQEVEAVVAHFLSPFSLTSRAVLMKDVIALGVIGIQAGLHCDLRDIQRLFSTYVEALCCRMPPHQASLPKLSSLGTVATTTNLSG